MLHALLHNLDQHAERRGWDTRPALYVLYDERGRGAGQYQRAITHGSMCSAGPYAARTLIPRAMFEQVTVAAVLRRLAFGFVDTNPMSVRACGPILGVLRGDSFRGFALVASAWVRNFGSVQEVRNYAAGPLRLPDLIGSQECRLIHAIDVDGASHDLVRRRGEPAAQVVHTGAGRPDQGEIPDLMREILAAVQRPTDTRVRVRR